MKTKIDDHAEFKDSCKSEILSQGQNTEFIDITNSWMAKSAQFNYSYHFEWLGRPIIQYPQDMVVVQQLIWQIKPDLIIETGIARGGSLLFYASLLELLSLCGEAQNSAVVGIDIDIRSHNREAIERHPLARKIKMLEGSSTSHDIAQQVQEIAQSHQRIMVILDSNHTHEHVLEELKIYAPLVTQGSYCLVFDTVVEHLPEVFSANRPWGKSNNPKTAVEQYLKLLKTETSYGADGQTLIFEIDLEPEKQMMITVAPGGYLRRSEV